MYLVGSTATKNKSRNECAKKVEAKQWSKAQIIDLVSDNNIVEKQSKKDNNDPNKGLK